MQQTQVLLDLHKWKTWMFLLLPSAKLHFYSELTKTAFAGKLNIHGK